MRIPTLLSIIYLLVPLALTKQQKAPEPCTIFHPTTNAYYDLNAITKKAHKDDRTWSWHTWGYDYGTNFSLNFCAPVIETLDSAVGIEKDLVKNISAFYKYKGETYSIGQVSTEPVFRGRKLSLNYTSGSPCDEPLTRERRKLKDGDDDDDKDDEDDDDDHKSHKSKDKDKDRHKDNNVRRKSTLISFSCDQNLATGKAHISFIGASPDECAYFFEAKSVAACGGVVEAPSGLGAGGVFSVMFATLLFFVNSFIIFLVVYILGGVAYQRTVMHQRGWRQLPNYNVWASIANLLKDLIVIFTSSCARVLPRRQGYNHLPSHGRGGRGSRADDENRLIDQLDEEWDD
ncbi:MAG: hypothetical protein LQ351_006760 [Letrouitia transgressa]|nr:MAG: hypothetical protein LQ351_006760 [Letrouitia transgressa]